VVVLNALKIIGVEKMNDFTKEELIYLHHSVVQSVIEFREKNLHNVSDIFKQLTKKIQSMIDNYCEHDCPQIRDSNAIEACPTCGEYHDN
jgi:hypothetical protein